MEAPDTKAYLLLAIRDKAVQERGKETKEAEPIPVGATGRVEQFLTLCSATKMKRPLQMFVWWVLCMIYASLRFEDACHVRPDGLAMGVEAFTGSSWQTKTERRRKKCPLHGGQLGNAMPRMAAQRLDSLQRESHVRQRLLDAARVLQERRVQDVPWTEHGLPGVGTVSARNATSHGQSLG